MIVGEGDPSDTAAATGLREHRRYVILQQRPGIDDPRRVAADQPRVRAGQGEGPGVACAHAGHPEVVELAPPAYLRGEAVDRPASEVA